jgi:hypothetical protein
MMGHSVSFFASNNKMRMKWITGDIQKFTEYIKSKIEKTDLEHTQSESTVDVANQIRKLAELKDEGILTEDEFESKKKQC